MQQTTADGCSLADGSSDLGETTFREDFVVGVELDNQTSTFASSQKIAFLQMSWQPPDERTMSREENKQFDPGG